MKRPLEYACRSHASVGERHRVAGEGDGDRRAELELRRVLGGEQQRQERVVARLGGPRAGVAGALQLGGLLAGPCPARLRCLRRPSWPATYAQPSERAEEGGGRVGPRRQCPHRGVVLRMRVELASRRRSASRPSTSPSAATSPGASRQPVDTIGDQVRQVPVLASRPPADRRAAPRRRRSRTSRRRSAARTRRRRRTGRATVERSTGPCTTTQPREPAVSELPADHGGCRRRSTSSRPARCSVTSPVASAAHGLEQFEHALVGEPVGHAQDGDPAAAPHVRRRGAGRADRSPARRRGPVPGSRPCSPISSSASDVARGDHRRRSASYTKRSSGRLHCAPDTRRCRCRQAAGGRWRRATRQASASG